MPLALARTQAQFLVRALQFTYIRYYYIHKLMQTEITLTGLP